MDRRRHVRPLLLERLEDRTLLSSYNYTVNGLGDAGAGSGLAGDLRDRVNLANANPGSTIQFGVTGAINLGSGLTINANMTHQRPRGDRADGLARRAVVQLQRLHRELGVTASISGLTMVQRVLFERRGGVEHREPVVD